MADRIAGTIEVQVNGKVIKVAGNVSSNIGSPIKEGLVGPDSVHGYKEMPQIPFIEFDGRIITGGKIKDLTEAVDATVTAKYATGKIVMISDAWFAGEGTYGSDEGTIACKFEGMGSEEIGG